MPLLPSTVPMFPDLRGKIAIVTGGSRGIGAETCLALATNGVKVAINGRDEAAIQATVQAIRTIHGEAIAAPADCARLSSVEAMRDRVHEELGAPDFVLAFAGGAPDGRCRSSRSRKRTGARASGSIVFLHRQF